MKESKGSKKFKHATKNNKYDDAQNQVKKKKEKNPKPNTRRHDEPFCKSIQRTKRLGNKH
jgi:hypothetical protein